MSKMTYREQLLHPHWQRKRLEVMDGAGFQCESCGDATTTLNVHHRRYVKGRMAWEYLNEELACLCWPCHAQEHEHRELLGQLLISSEASMQMAVGLIAGYLGGQLSLHEDLEVDALRVGGPYFIEGGVAALLASLGWRAVGLCFRELVTSRQLSVNPAGQTLIDFLCDQPEPARNL